MVGVVKTILFPISCRPEQLSSTLRCTFNLSAVMYHHPVSLFSFSVHSVTLKVSQSALTPSYVLKMKNKAKYRQKFIYV